MDLSDDSLTTYIRRLLGSDGVKKADEDEARRKMQMAAAEAIVFSMVRK